MKIILVDGSDNELGSMDKMKAHKEGALHRAFSVFVFNKDRELMLQKRSFKKYHSPGLWSNTCCSHPAPGEVTIEAAKKRLMEEMGLDIGLTERFSFIYRAEMKNGLIEHEFDHVFFGFNNLAPKPCLLEVSNWKWISLDKLKSEIQKNPESYTPWLRLCLDKVIEELNTPFPS